MDSLYKLVSSPFFAIQGHSLTKTKKAAQAINERYDAQAIGKEEFTGRIGRLLQDIPGSVSDNRSCSACLV
jgi:hypothetical protein